MLLLSLDQALFGALFQQIFSLLFQVPPLPCHFWGDPSKANMQYYFKSLIQILDKDIFTVCFALTAPQLSFHSTVSNTLAFPRTRGRGCRAGAFPGSPSSPALTEEQRDLPLISKLTAEIRWRDCACKKGAAAACSDSSTYITGNAKRA